MKKLKILIDLDNITADTLPYWLEYLAHKAKMPVAAKVEDITKWNMAECHPLDTIDPKLVLGVLQDNYFTINVPLMPGARQAIQELMIAGHEVYLVTARSGHTHVTETFEWVAKMLPFINIREQLIFCSNKALIPADVLIDDKPDTLIKYKKTHPGAVTMTIRYPYNTHLEAPHKVFGLNVNDRRLVWGQMLGYIEFLAEVLDIPTGDE